MIVGAEDFSTPVLETSAIVPMCQRETGETKGGNGKAEDRDGDEDNEVIGSGRRRDPSTSVPKTSAVVPECQHEAGEMGGGCVETWPEANIHAGKEVAYEEAKGKAVV